MTAIIAMDHFKNTFNTESVGSKIAVMYSLYTV